MILRLGMPAVDLIFYGLTFNQVIRPKAIVLNRSISGPVTLPPTLAEVILLRILLSEVSETWS